MHGIRFVLGLAESRPTKLTEDWNKETHFLLHTFEQSRFGEKVEFQHFQLIRQTTRVAEVPDKLTVEAAKRLFKNVCTSGFARVVCVRMRVMPGAEKRCDATIFCSKCKQEKRL